MDAPMADHLFLDMPSSVTLGIVETEMQLATANIPSCLAGRLANERITLLTKYTAVKNLSSGNKSTLANFF
jgi:hypothetical protein